METENEMIAPQPDWLPLELLLAFWDALPWQDYPKVRFVCRYWHAIWRQRREEKTSRCLTVVPLHGRRHQGHYTILPNGKRHGRMEQFTMNGNPFYVAQYYDGLLDGEAVLFFGDSKKTHLVTNYVKGQKDGQRVEYNLLGQVMCTTEFVGDLKHGWHRTYNHTSKSTTSAIHYSMGKRHGACHQRTYRGDVALPTTWWWHGTKCRDYRQYLARQAAEMAGLVGPPLPLLQPDSALQIAPP